MKKKGIFFVFLFLLILSSFFIAAANQTETKAYSCLEEKVTDKCSTLSTEEKIFSLLAIDRCKTELISDSLAEECWPDVGCKIKTTAQAILALNRVNTNTVAAENWLLTQTLISSDLNWFLQVEADGKTSCTATYSGSSYSFTVNEDKTITGGTTACFSVYNNYWLKISSTCYDSEFKISCKNSFITSLLYKKKTSSTVYISKNTNSASGEGTTTEKVTSSCFKSGTSCDYEGTLWASLILKYRGYDVSAYIPYITAMADENQKYVPESFLYSLTNSFRTDLLARQQENKWWSVSGDKFYDTAVALLPFPNEQVSEKTNSINWLGEVQDEDGCWQGNIRNTAFLLYSIWPKKKANVSSSAKDCESFSYNCMSSASCNDASGTILADYTGCFGTNICCNKPKQLQTCAAQNGELCDSDEDCLDGSTVSSSDTTSGKVCCVDGTCGVQQTSQCELQGGTCKSTCLTNEKYSSYSCASGNCCMPTSSKKSGVLLIIILSVLIVLVLLGIIFRKKLKTFFSKLGKGKTKKTLVGPRFPPSSQKVYPGAVPRKIITQQQTKTATPPKRPQKKSEFDDVLKKLKDIGK